MNDEIIKTESNGYYIALEKAKGWAAQGSIISDKMIPTLHALMMGDGHSKIVPSTYREADISNQMKTLVDWINTNSGSIPCHIIAGFAYHQCLKLQPFNEGSDILAKLLRTIILEVGGCESSQFQFEENAPESEKIDKKDLMRSLDSRQRKALKLFKDYSTITASQIGEQFNLKARTRAQVCKDWVDSGFLEVVDFSNKARKYKLTKEFEELVRTERT
jgi:hypothetical protein